MINFPNNPIKDEIYQENGKTWQWDGNTWIGVAEVIGMTVYEQIEEPQNAKPGDIWIGG